MQPLIEVENLSFRFPDGTVGIEGINLRVNKGEFIIVAGMNGSGKTTFLRHLNGLLLPDSGTVKLKGIPVSEDIVRARLMVGMVFQDADTQIVGETVYDDVAFGPENLRMSKNEVNHRVMEALAAVGLTAHADKMPHLLSGGERRRLAIAGVLAMKPDVVIFDEPFSNLDYPATRQVLEQMVALHQTGHTIFVTTHDLEKVIAFAGRLIIMKNSRIVMDGPPDVVLPQVEDFGIRQPCAFRIGKNVDSWLN